MGMKKAGLASATSSCFTAVKHAFRSSSKKQAQDNGSKENSSRRREEDGPEHRQLEKKREKRRWLFSKSVPRPHCKVSVLTGHVNSASNAEQRHAVAIGIAGLTSSSSFLREHVAIVVIQTAFRGFLARKALRALKGLVKLQALVRGQNVRRQAEMTLQCMQALVRVQDQMRDQRARLSHEGARRFSMFSGGRNSLSDCKLYEDASERRLTVSRDGSGHLDDWDEPSRTLEEIDKMLQRRKMELMKREQALANAFSQQLQRSRSRRSISSGKESGMDDGAKWLDTWMAEKQLEKSSRVSTDADHNSVKAVELNSSRPRSYTSTQMARSPQRVPSPRRQARDFSLNYQSPTAPSTPKIRQLQVRSASPRYFKEEKSYSTSHTPTFGDGCRLSGHLLDEKHRNASGVATLLPNYMSATESAKAKARSQSAPRTRLPTPERERSGGSVKKRLSYQPEEQHARATATSRLGGTSQDMTSPGFRSFHDFSSGLDLKSNPSNYYTESLTEEISLCSVTDLGRWLR
uniref:DUF4005 domain-containing protein n=1 Tax=Kalanchoe fedtschenkoi TaxID=63787 RepID=A0A7N0UIR4_KALFE